MNDNDEYAICLTAPNNTLWIAIELSIAGQTSKMLVSNTNPYNNTLIMYMNLLNVYYRHWIVRYILFLHVHLQRKSMAYFDFSCMFMCKYILL